MGKGDKNHRNRKAGPREPSGKLSRKPDHVEQRRSEAAAKAFEESEMQTALMARRRHRREFREPVDPKSWREKDAKPVSKQQMKNQQLDKRGSVLGSMWADGDITEEQHAAGLDYCERYISYSALNGLPRPTAQAASYGAVRGGSRPDRLKAAMAAKADHAEDQRILRQCSAGVTWAIKRACVTDEQAPVKQVREGLQALVNAGR
ncbi:hypothetical protein [Tranquillimonas rosea]|uniref:hypothetical protein n=1 Tax=Tranquillimonas rosea TaxID=641238 RepID=UPI003BA8824E